MGGGRKRERFYGGERGNGNGRGAEQTATHGDRLKKKRGREDGNPNLPPGAGVDLIQCVTKEEG